MAFTSLWDPIITQKESKERREEIALELLGFGKEYVKERGFSRLEILVSPLSEKHSEIYNENRSWYEKAGFYKATKEDIMNKLKELKMDFDDSVDKWRMVDLLWKYCRKQLSGPGFLVGQPVELTPLAKRSEKDPRKVEQFQVILGGSEVGNGYSELNDPIDQESRFKEQRELGEAGDEEAMEHDESFVEALRYGMPPACGFGFSERLFGFMMNKPLRETVLFPLMRPEGAEKPKEKKRK
jgi:lysyl-tRNA synthetase class 2